MIHYHGGPITPDEAAFEVWSERHAMISYAYPRQIKHAAEYSQSFVIDNGAWTKKKQGGELDVDGFYEFVEAWRRHPGFDWAVIPDVIDGTETANDVLLAAWPFPKHTGVPVWHLHESLRRLTALRDEWQRIAIGSSGEFIEIGTQRWWSRMNEAMEILCGPDGYPLVKFHGLRMLDNTLKSHIPFSSGDSCYAAINSQFTDSRKSIPFDELPRDALAYALARRCQRHAGAQRWKGSSGIQKNLDLVG